MIRKIITFCVIALLFFTCSQAAFAEEFYQDELGSISVTLTEQNEPIVGAELSVYYVATVMMDEDGNLLYDYTEDFEKISTPINDANLATKLDSFVEQNDLPSVTITTNDDGTALCDELSLGLYFVKQTGVVDGFAPCKPFIVTVPSENDGEYLYNVNASPKTEVEKVTSITIKKVWNTSASAKASDSITVQLINNGNVVETAILNEENNWQITYNNMPLSDDYSIKEVNVPKGFTDTYKQDGNIFTVTNTSTLIQTGQLMWPIPVLAFGGILFIAIGVMFIRKKRQTNA